MSDILTQSKTHRYSPQDFVDGLRPASAGLFVCLPRNIFFRMLDRARGKVVYLAKNEK